MTGHIATPNFVCLEMKVFASTLAAFAIGQESSDKWTGFDYDYGFGDNTNLQKNQVSQSAVGNTAWAQQTDTPSLNAVQSALDSANLQTIYNFHGASVTGFDGKDFHKMELGNGRMCWFCDSDSKGIRIFFETFFEYFKQPEMQLECKTSSK